MTDKIKFGVTRRGTRYGVHVENMTKVEARHVLEAVVTVKCGHENGTMTGHERDDILEATETATSLDPLPSGERWANRIVFSLIATGIFLFAFHDIIRDLIIR